MQYTLNEQFIKMVINTLKTIDARGYESMYAIVGLVTMFENILKLPTQKPKGEEDNAISNEPKP